MAEIILTPADDIVTDINALSGGDVAILTAGTYTFTGDILKSNVEVRSEIGVILECTGSMLTGSVTTALFTGHAVINTGTISFDATTVTFECDESSVDIDIDADKGSIRIGAMHNNLTTRGPLSISASVLEGDYSHDSKVDGNPTSISIGSIIGGTLYVKDHACFLNLYIGSIVTSTGNSVKLDACSGTADIFYVESGNNLQLNLACDLNLKLQGPPPSIELVDDASSVIVSGNVSDTLNIDGDVVLDSFQSICSGNCITGVSGDSVYVGPNTSFFSLVEPIATDLNVQKYSKSLKRIEQPILQTSSKSGAITLDTSHSYIKSTLSGNVTSITLDNDPSTKVGTQIVWFVTQVASGTAATIDWTGSSVVYEKGKTSTDYQVDSVFSSVTEYYLIWNGTKWGITMIQRA